MCSLTISRKSKQRKSVSTGKVNDNVAPAIYSAHPSLLEIYVSSTSSEGKVTYAVLFYCTDDSTLHSSTTINQGPIILGSCRKFLTYVCFPINVSIYIKGTHLHLTKATPVIKLKRNLLLAFQQRSKKKLDKLKDAKNFSL